MTIRILTALLFSFSISYAAPSRKDTFVEALAEAKKVNQPIAVFVHGSSWHPASRVFGQKIWRNEAFSTLLKYPVILTNIEIKQNLDKRAAKKEEEKFKGWKAVSTYPAVQIYGSDGHLLKSYSGRELRVMTSPESLANHLNHILEAAGKRGTLLADLAKARAEKNQPAELSALTRLLELPLNNEAKIVQQLQKADPDDTSGWQARLSFKNWEFMRHITGLIHEKKSVQALAETNRLLATAHHTPEQRALILAAKGKALAAQGKLPEAWAAFQEAHRCDPKGANGKAVLKYGARIAGEPLREVLPAGSSLNGKPIDDNLTRDHATFTMSSASSDDAKSHSSLFKGRHARSGYAFHTNNEKGAHIIIDLQSSCQVKALRITNRNKLKERASSLTVWASADQTTWTQLWTAEKPEATWDILLDQPATARYLKVGLQPETSNFLHLRAVDVYGVRP